MIPHQTPDTQKTLKADTERLREWSRLIHVHGHDISEWGAAPFVAGELERIAARLDTLLSAPSAPEGRTLKGDRPDDAALLVCPHGWGRC